VGNPGKKLALIAGAITVQALRSALYVLLLLTGRVLRPIAGVSTATGILIFAFCFIFRRDMVVPMWAGFSLAVCSVAVTIFHEALLRLVAPRGTVIVSDL
jgi:hypothetical protein